MKDVFEMIKQEPGVALSLFACTVALMGSLIGIIFVTSF